MVWTSPMTFVDGRPLTAAQLNTHLRDNLLETEVAKATLGGGYFVASEPYSIVQRNARKATVITAETTTSADYGDLETVGPIVTCQTGATALVFISARVSNSSTGFQAMSVEVSGADPNTENEGEEGVQIEPTDDHALFCEGDGVAVSSFWAHRTLTPGTNRFTCKYRTDSGTASFQRRRLTVLPL